MSRRLDVAPADWLRPADDGARCWAVVPAVVKRSHVKLYLASDMSLDAAQSVAQFFGKPSQDLSAPDLEAEVEDGDVEGEDEMMSVRDLERALSLIRQRRRRLDVGMRDRPNSMSIRSLLTGGR